jgi:hypothetical protein
MSARPPAASTRAGAVNPGATSPSLSLSSSAAGVPEAAVIGKKGSLWYYAKVKGKWRATKLGGSDTAYSGPSLASESGTNAAVAVEGKSHSLLLFVTSKGRWHRLTVATRNAAYSVPSLAVGKNGPGIAVLGKGNSLWYYSMSKGRFHAKEIFSQGYAYSAPSLVIRSAAQATGADPAGEADIAVEASSHALYYVHSPRKGTNWQNAVVAGPGSVYAAPSLVVFASPLDRGEAYIAVEGPQNSLVTYNDGRGWTGAGITLLAGDGGWVYAAPTLVQNVKDPARPVAIAYRGSSNSIGFIFYNDGTSSPGWQNDPLGDVFHVDSPIALAAQLAGPAGQVDLLFQGTGNTLWYYQGRRPSTPVAPTFTSQRIGGPGSAYGG